MSKEKTEKRKCPICGVLFQWSSSMPQKKYCGYECASIARKQCNMINNPPKMISEVRKCIRCNKDFLWTTKKSNQIYCSDRCRQDVIKEKTTKVVLQEKRKCLVCNKEFVWYSNKPNRKYCSENCLRIATRKKIKDYQIDKTSSLLKEEEMYVTEIVTRLISRANEVGESYNGKLIDYWLIGDISEKVRGEVLERDKRQCCICSCNVNLHIHHIVKRRLGGDHSADNLITLCASCHRHIETGDIDHAIKKCVRNRLKNCNISEETPETSIMERVQHALYILNNFFNEFADEYSDERELLVKLDCVINELEDITK